MKRVAISQRLDHVAGRGETRDGLDQRLIAFFDFAGFVPVPVPNLSNWFVTDDGLDSRPLSDWMAAVKPDAIVLSGGADIGQSPSRDYSERWLLDFADPRGLPVLGICRGMQMMAERAGTGLNPVLGHAGSRHTVVGEISGEVNSYHHFSITQCPSGYRVLARSQDGHIEAIADESLNWEGWMWHPERESEFSARDIERVRALFNA